MPKSKANAMMVTQLTVTSSEGHACMVSEANEAGLGKYDILLLLVVTCAY